MSDEVDGWIVQLMQCKPLSEAEVKKLCDKVCIVPSCWAGGIGGAQGAERGGHRAGAWGRKAAGV